MSHLTESLAGAFYGSDMTRATRGEATISGVAQRTEAGHRVFRVSDPNALTQLMGWLKFTANGGQVLYRGQGRIHSSMYASGLRGIGGASASEAERATLATSLASYITQLAGSECRCNEGPFPFGTAHRCDEQVARGSAGPLVGSTYRAVAEPLLQHYGIRTRWLDVVDNIWIALWFACHTEKTEGLRHAFHQRRSPDAEQLAATTAAVAGTSRAHVPMAYVAVIDTGSLRSTQIPGYSIGDEIRVVDLRYAVPSVYLRPHAQHGILVAPPKLPSGGDGALTERVVAYIEIALNDALSWLGSGVMTSPFVLFPPAASDHGFRRLLDYVPVTPAQLGSIKIYGPGS